MHFGIFRALGKIKVFSISYFLIFFLIFLIFLIFRCNFFPNLDTCPQKPNFLLMQHLVKINQCSQCENHCVSRSSVTSSSRSPCRLCFFYMFRPVLRWFLTFPRQFSYIVKGINVRSVEALDGKQHLQKRVDY